MPRHPSIGKWCGPTALAVVAGIDYEAAVERLKRRKRARRPWLARLRLEGCTTVDLGAELATLGAEPLGATSRPRPTLGAWLDRHHRPQSFTVIWLTGHYITVYGGTLVDNHEAWVCDRPDRRKRGAGLDTPEGLRAGTRCTGGPSRYGDAVWFVEAPFTLGASAMIARSTDHGRSWVCAEPGVERLIAALVARAEARAAVQLAAHRLL